MVFSITQFLMVMVSILVILGVVCIGGGVFILISKSFNKDIRVIADETVRLGEKGITDDLSGLVGNASALLDSLNQMVRTASGIGIFLMITGFILFVGAAYILFQMA